MEKCDYGCDQEAKYVFKNGKHCCSKTYRSCPFQADKIGKTRIGKKHTEETKKRIGNKSKERIAQRGGSYFKGKKHTEETKKRISEKNIGREKPLGYIPWNKGLTKETDTRIASGDRVKHSGNENGMFGKSHSDEVKEKQRQKNLKEGKWKGMNNPWYGKDRSKENSPRYLTKAERTKWEQYKQEVRMLTERTYKNNIEIINPDGYNRATKEYHLDHIIPIWYGFIHTVPSLVLALPDNLRIIRWSENLERSKTSLTESEQHLLQHLLEIV